MKIRNKIVTFITTLVCFATVVFPFGSSQKANAESLEPIPIDMYLIGGQSNASGYSNIPGGTQGETYENVWYAGQTDRICYNSTAITPSSDYTQRFKDFERATTIGFGRDSGKIGPEYGMARVLAQTATAEHPAMIFKTAAGGTAISDRIQTTYGTWTPPSLWKEGYTPVIDEVVTDGTGVMYQLFLSNFERVYNLLKENGYAPVVKGMAWMQGEAESAPYHDNYAELLETFITDLRADLVDITGDISLTSMPFAVAEICPHFGYYNNVAAQNIIQQQREVATKLANSRVASINNEDLTMNIWEDGKSVTVGSDSMHYNFKDATTLGERFATKLRELGGARSIAVQAENGTATCTIDDVDSTFTATLVPEKHYKVSQVLLNNVDVTADVANNTYRGILQEGANLLVVKFVEKDKYSVSYETTSSAGCQYTPKVIYDGEILSLKVYPAKDYEVVKVFYNDVEMTYNEETNSYEIVPTQSGMVKIETKAIATGNNSGSGNDGSGSDTGNKSNGCSSVIGLLGVVPVLGLMTAGLVLAKEGKRSKRN